MRKLFLVLVGSAWLPFAGAAEPAQGSVFHDANGNGLFDQGEDGLPGVLVSDGEEVVVTDEGGRWELPLGEDVIYFVIQPSGWQVPLNERNLPQFFHIHKPAGSPEGMRFEGVPPTGPLPESIHFPLTRSEAGEEFSFFAFGDPQPYSEEQVEFFRRDIVEEAKLVEGPVGGVTLGDIVGDDLDLYEPMTAAIAQMGLPWWQIHGNHDMNFDAASEELADETFERIFGPATYAFQIGKVTFLALDNVLYPNHHTQNRYVGGFMDRQITFIANLLKHVPEDHLILSMMHIPLFDEDYADTFLDEHRKRFFALFEKHPHTLSLSAHTHMQRHHFFHHEHDHWPHVQAPHHHYNVGTTSGSWWGGALDERGIPETTMRDGTPNGYAILQFEGNEYRYDYKVANAPADYQMNVHLTKAVHAGGRTSVNLAVNFFNGSEQAKVEFRVDGESWRSARRSERIDPSYAYLALKREFDEAPRPGRPLPAPQECFHLWTARIRADRLEPGTHEVEVRVTDRFGRVFQDQGSFEVLQAIE
ncbi:MAG: calcineurin-like phosphoesterase family protein [Verrucomicrobiota bacterium]